MGIDDETGINEKALGVSPFANSFSIPVRELEVPRQYVLTNGVYKNNVIQVEYVQATKLYTSASRRKMIAEGLTLRAKELLLWLLYELKPGKPYVWINKVRYMKECHIAAPFTYRLALKNLTDQSILAKSGVKNVYWINPDICFKGSRADAFPENVVLKYGLKSVSEAE